MNFLIIKWPNFVYLLVDSGFYPLRLNFYEASRVVPPIVWTPLTNTMDKETNEWTGKETSLLENFIDNINITNYWITMYIIFCLCLASLPRHHVWSVVCKQCLLNEWMNECNFIVTKHMTIGWDVVLGTCTCTRLQIQSTCTCTWRVSTCTCTRTRTRTCHFELQVLIQVLHLLFESALRALSVPASSAPVERVFHRSRMADKTLVVACVLQHSF